MFPLLVALCAVLVGPSLARPPHSSTSDIDTLAKLYASKHPNSGIGHNEEYGDLYQGDIIVGDGKVNRPQANLLNAIVDPEKLWPGGVIYYTIQNGVYTAEEVARIEAGIKDLQDKTRVNGRECVRIQYRNDERDYVSVENYDGCSSYIGRQGGSQRLSLVSACTTRHATIMHEFLHAFGFYHEQSRSDRDDWVTINWSNIQRTTLNNFIKMPEGQINLLGTEYDYGSCMHYGAYAFAIDPSIPTIIPHDPDAEIGQRDELSQLDIERVQILYGCLEPEESTYFKGIDRASLIRQQ